MPELPDVDVYVEALRERTQGRTLEKFVLGSPFVLRSVQPPPSIFEGTRVEGVERLGKRIVLRFEQERSVVIHLMIAGRFRWSEPGKEPSLRPKNNLALWTFESGSLLLTEAGSKKRASIFLVDSLEALGEHDPGGLEILEISLGEFTERLRARNHTVKRSLTDPRIFSGVGNAYSDEILHRAKLSPLRWTSRLDDEQVAVLFGCARAVLTEWRDLLRRQAKGEFPKKVTAFHPKMSVHGKYQEPCPVCGDPVQRILYASNECNYCVTCQTGGKVLADRALSRLLGKDWPRTLEELEERRSGRR